MNTKKSTSVANSHYHHLKKRWGEKHHTKKKSLWDKHKTALEWVTQKFPSKEDLTAGGLGSLLFLSSPAMIGVPIDTYQTTNNASPVEKEAFFIADLTTLLPRDVIPLTHEEEKTVSSLITRYYGVPVTAEVNGLRLNRNYGLIGKEQHLMRYPGDTVASHFATDEEAQVFGRDGLAPGKGAWGYFANSREEMTEQDIEREKYYIAVPTFLSPDFMQNVAVYRDFYKYRKMLLVNPENGRAMVVVIADAGPAEWTGKHLGGSPEVMKYLERVDGKQKGAVLYFFIDDAGDTIPLGPRQIL